MEYVYRIDTTDPSQRWQFTCPHPQRHTDWRVTDGLFECLAEECKQTYDHLINQKTGEKIHRSEIELVGPKADHQGQFGKPTVE